ncbi:MAG TPA: response regulator transcription factor [Candidatus Kapabacteria bacterium]|nr:response regulator transcription factor [Candidatus Kapabacteria bacterium]
MKRILIIEDDPAIRLGLEESLTAEGYQMMTASDGADGFIKAQSPNVDLIILDLMLPAKGGMDICRDLRAASNNVLVMMLTSKNEEIDKVLGLEVGADDYMTKPFGIRELQARIKALFRRSGELKKGVEVASFGFVNVDFVKQELLRNGEVEKCSTKEFQILKFFLEHESQVVTRDMLLDAVWGYDVFPTTRTVDNYILSLRKKIEDTPSEPKYLLTVHTSGYKFVLKP